MTPKEYRHKKRNYVNNELKFLEKDEFVVFKYAYRLPLGRRELKVLETEDKNIESSEEWKRYFKKTYKNRKRRRKMIEYAEIQEIEYSVYEEFYSGLFMALMVSLLILIIQTIITLPINVDFSNAPKWAALIVIGIYFIVAVSFLLFILFGVAYVLTGDMKNRKYKKKFYSEIVKTLKK